VKNNTKKKSNPPQHQKVERRYECKPKSKEARVDIPQMQSHESTRIVKMK